MPAPLFCWITTSPGFISASIASQHACVEWLALRMDRQSSVEFTTTVVAPCAAALRNCAINSYLK